MVIEMEKDAVWNKNSKCHNLKGHRTGSRRKYKKYGLLPRRCIGATKENEFKKKTDIF